MNLDLINGGAILGQDFTAFGAKKFDFFSHPALLSHSGESGPITWSAFLPALWLFHSNSSKPVGRYPWSF